jgi:chromate transporter
MELVELFLTFAKISLLSFGGGWTTLAIMEHEIQVHGWMTAEEFTKVIYLTATTPGPNAIGSAALVGRHVGGYAGMIAAVLGVIVPTIIVVFFMYFVFIKYRDNVYLKSILKGIAPVVVAMIVWMAWKIGVPVFKDFNLVVVIIGLTSAGLLFVGVHPGWLILGGGLAGLALLR